MVPVLCQIKAHKIKKRKTILDCSPSHTDPTIDGTNEFSMEAKCSEFYAW